MIPDGQYTAVVDRIEDGHATILLEEDGEDAHELVVYPEALPSDGRHSDAILAVEINDDELAEAKYRPAFDGILDHDTYSSSLGGRSDSRSNRL